MEDLKRQSPKTSPRNNLLVSQTTGNKKNQEKLLTSGTELFTDYAVKIHG